MNDGEAKYHFDYDALGRKTAVQTSRADSGKHWLAEYTYTKNNMTSQKYSNGVQVDFEYDNLDRLVEKRYGDFRTAPIRYSYDPNGNLYKVSDGLWSVGIETGYTYDLAGRIVGVRAVEEGTQNHRAALERRYTDKKGTVESQRVEIYGASNRAEEKAKYTYRYGDYQAHEMPGVVYEVKKDGKDFLSYAYDGLGRVTSRGVGGLTNREKYTYNPGPNGTTTTQVQKFSDLQGLETTYTYDVNGNITAADSKEASDRYVYDALGRMVRANNGDSDVELTETYEYDARGNIVSRTRYNYTTAETPTRPKKTITYKYEDASWSDLLTEYDGQKLTYDNIGNPLTYRDGMTMTWKHGRSLRDIQKDGETQGSYNYNGDGLRTYKSTKGYGTTEYHILDGQYVGETKTLNGKTYHTLYLYDEAGSIIGLQENGETYYFVKNLQGDVIGILDSKGEAVGYYFYDVWGNIAKVYSNSNWDEVSDPEHIALRNPFRYRGYMYDEESGLYYLQSRYYDPVTGRFVNADGFVSTGQGLMGNNMFAYCNDNPVMFVDPTGRFIGTATAAGLIALGKLFLAAAAATIVVGAVTTLPPPTLPGTISRPGDNILAPDIAAPAPRSKDEAKDKADEKVIEKPIPKKQKVFPENPLEFNPTGLIPTTYVETGSGKNGGIIKWEIPGTTMAIFEWDEGMNEVGGSHYHVMLPAANNKHLEGGHYKAGELVPEPWNSMYFGGN